MARRAPNRMNAVTTSSLVFPDSPELLVLPSRNKPSKGITTGLSAPYALGDPAGKILDSQILYWLGFPELAAMGAARMGALKRRVCSWPFVWRSTVLDGLGG